MSRFRTYPARHNHFPGFTLVELVIVIIISGIVSLAMARFIAQPVEGYFAQARRTELVDLADTALHRMTRELRLALPNSVRVDGSGKMVELLRTLDGGRYRAEPDPSLPGSDILSFIPTDTDTGFDVLGQVRRIGEIDTAGTGAGDDCQQGLRDCLVIYNTSQAGADAYQGDNIATITAAGDGGAADGVSDHLSFDNSQFTGGLPVFPYSSPTQRFYVVDTPVTFLCNETAGTITRYADYRITDPQPTIPSALPLSAAGAVLVINNVASCDFQYAQGTATRAGLVTLRITVTKQGESVTMLQQAHTYNAP